MGRRSVAVGLMFAGLLLASVPLWLQQGLQKNSAAEVCIRLRAEMREIGRLLPEYYRTGYAPNGRNPDKEFWQTLHLQNENCSRKSPQNLASTKSKSATATD